MFEAAENDWRKTAMPKISDIEETPNPNAVKFVLREAVSNGVAQQFVSAAQAANDPLAKALFDVGHVVSVFYMDRMITVEKDDEGDWDELLPTLAVPIRAAESVASATSAAAAVGGAIAAATSDDPRLVRVNELLDEKVRPYLMSDGGYLEILSLNDHTLTIRYQGACGSCPSSRCTYRTASVSERVFCENAFDPLATAHGSDIPSFLRGLTGPSKQIHSKESADLQLSGTFPEGLGNLLWNPKPARAFNHRIHGCYQHAFPFNLRCSRGENYELSCSPFSRRCFAL